MTKARDLGSNAQNTKPKVIDAKADLIVGTASDTADRLAVGNNGETLVADSSTSTGLRWQGTYAAGKNRIINGAMLFDQRNSGSAVTINAAASSYTLDRFVAQGQATDGVFTVQQDSTAPNGFSKSLKVTVTTADASIGTTQLYLVGTRIEGNNIADFAFGTSAAKTLALSFWVRSSLTGTFGGAIRNANADRSYPFTYTINAANTWEQKSVTITGDTTGTWANDSTNGMNVHFSIGAGADRIGTAGAWAATNYAGATGQTNLISTLNATWYVTGIQLEIGSAATAFTLAGGNIAGELAACQRYYYRIAEFQIAGGTQSAAENKVFFALNSFNGVPMRTTPTAAFESTPYITNGASNLRTVTAVAVASKAMIGFTYDSTRLTDSYSYMINAADAGRAVSLSAEL